MTDTVTITFDPDAPAVWSAANATLAANEPALTEQIERDRATYTEQFAGLTKDQIIATAAEVGITLKGGYKPELVKAAVDGWLEMRAETKELKRLKMNARRDLHLVSRLLGAIREYEQQTAKLQHALAVAATARLVTHAMSWQTDPLMLAAATADYAKQVIREVEQGAEIRDAAMKIGMRAMYEVMGFPHRVMSNGAGGGHRLEEAAQANAASNFVTRILGSTILGDTVPSEWLTQ